MFYIMIDWLFADSKKNVFILMEARLNFVFKSIQDYTILDRYSMEYQADFREVFIL